MQVPIAYIDEAVLNRDVDAVGGTPEVVQVTLAILGLDGRDSERQREKQ